MPDHSWEAAGLGRSPATLETRGEALVGGALRRFADRARYADAIEQFLLGAPFPKPFVVGRGKRLAGGEAGAGAANAELCRLLGLVISRPPRRAPGHRDGPLLDDVVAVLQRQRRRPA